METEKIQTQKKKQSENEDQHYLFRKAETWNNMTENERFYELWKGLSNYDDLE